jgi:amylosucrase
MSELAPLARDRLGVADGDAFLGRLDRLLPDITRPLEKLYSARIDVASFVRSLLGDTLDFATARSESLRALDRDRESDPGWFQDPGMVGYVCYVDRFGGTLQGVRARLDYLSELGVGYVHLMPVLATRPGENDGGYAVVDYDAVDLRFGTMTDLTELADELHDRGISLCLDLVLNHTAREHEWARRAMSGELGYRDFYLIYPDRAVPDAYEATLPDIFPEMTPGSFSYVPELAGWVWTTFREFQWDLNYANPAVFQSMLATMLRLANRGADVLRLDAAPFLWKRLGTNCQDQPEAHLLLGAFRALTRIAAPSVLLKAEAMLEPDLLGKYLGDHDRYVPECDLAYDNQLMVMLWSALASRDSRLATQALTRRRPAPLPTSWVTYLRGHDDIGWAVSDTDAAAVGLDGATHRRFLSDFYAGATAGSFARGARFQSTQLGASPTSGMSASLCGIEVALADGDDAQLDLAIRRLETLYSVVFSFGGIPVIYMGDEIAMRNDPHWRDEVAHRDDNRWMHRPWMNWTAASRRRDVATLEERAFTAMRNLAAQRRSQPALTSRGQTTVVSPDNSHVFAYRRGDEGCPTFLAAVNFSDSPQTVDIDLVARAGIRQPKHVHSTAGLMEVVDSRLGVPAWGFVWLTDQRK